MLECLVDLDCLVKFQTSLVGVIGFLGVILTLIVNAWIARSHEKRQLDHRRDALISCLLAELKMFESAIIENNAALKKAAEQSSNVLIPRIKRPISPSLLHEFGILAPKNVHTILEAFLSIDSAEDRMTLLTQQSNERFIEIGANRILTVIELRANVLEKIQSAIAEIE